MIDFDGTKVQFEGIFLPLQIVDTPLAFLIQKEREMVSRVRRDSQMELRMSSECNMKKKESDHTKMWKKIKEIVKERMGEIEHVKPEMLAEYKRVQGLMMTIDDKMINLAEESEDGDDMDWWLSFWKPYWKVCHCYLDECRTALVWYRKVHVQTVLDVKAELETGKKQKGEFRSHLVSKMEEHMESMEKNKDTPMDKTREVKGLKGVVAKLHMFPLKNNVRARPTIFLGPPERHAWRVFRNKIGRSLDINGNEVTLSKSRYSSGKVYPQLAELELPNKKECFCTTCTKDVAEVGHFYYCRPCQKHFVCSKRCGDAALHNCKIRLPYAYCYCGKDAIFNCWRCNDHDKMYCSQSCMHAAHDCPSSGKNQTGGSNN